MRALTSKPPTYCMQRSRRLRFVFMLNVYQRRVTDAARSPKLPTPETMIK
jgi:hypothetical protein